MCLKKILLLEENASDYIQKSACFSMELNVLVHKYEKRLFYHFLTLGFTLPWVSNVIKVISKNFLQAKTPTGS